LNGVKSGLSAKLRRMSAAIKSNSDIVGNPKINSIVLSIPGFE
jgi:hypothetical protein